MTSMTPTPTTFALTHARPGQRVRVSSVEGGQGLRARLCALGLTPGMTVEVVSANAGPVVLCVLGSRLVVGHGMAAKVYVREV